MESSQFSEQLQTQAYEILSSNDVKPMETLFSRLLSPQEPQRSHAHNLLLCCQDHHPCLLFIKLFYLLRYASNIDIRANSARLLRSRQWQELLDFLGRSLALENDKYQETALLVFAYMPYDCKRLICEALLPRIELLHGGLLRALASKNVDVKVAAFGAVISLLHLFSGSLGRDWFNDLLRAMMTGVFGLLKGEKEECAQKGLQELTKLVMEEPQILRPYLNNLVSDMLQLAESRILKDETKHCAIQFLMTMVEAKGLAPAMQMLSSECMVGLFIVPMRMLLGIQDAVAWYEMGNVESDNAGQTDTYNYGIKCLNQMSIVLGGKNIVPIAFKLLPMYMGALEWQRRHAGITMLGVISKECSDEMIMMEDYLQQAVKIILTSFQDSHPREAICGIRICAEFGGSQFKHFIKSALSKLGVVMACPNRSCMEDLKASDIAVSAIGKNLVPTWLSFLPIKNDLTEAKSVHEQLCLMVERLDKELLGPSCEHLHKIVVVYLEQNNNPKMAENPIRFGIMGCAKRARKLASAIDLAPNSTLYVASGSLEKAQLFATENELPKTIKIYGSYQEFLDDPSIDVVYMPLPSSLHLQWAVLAAQKKHHLLLEKPPALDVVELDEILEACESNGVQFMDGSMWLHHPRTAKMKELLSDPS
ncbi:hypothetical protein GH714_014161 [Hevea brasiliensis]|uniref:Uncharacterized protein n=1 Tax=Hevea brasiliensis TaxID=3981 RepID=A0A6A6KPP9_HEVBR|nr:hypothetical protein GH714_014161 [Hevea brasiliensis]